MNLQKTSIAFGAFALFAAAPFAAHAAPTVAIKTPVNGQTLSGRVNGANCATDATSSTGVSRVTFWANSWQINNDYSSPWNCDFDTKRLKDGAYTFKAVAYDRNGSSTTKTVSITINNKTPTTTTPPPAPANTPPAVSFKAPLNGATVRGWLDGSTCEALASDADGVKQVQFFLDSTALNTEGLAPWNCTVDTGKFSEGTHTLKAVATDAKGGIGTGQISINIQNGTTTPPPAPANTPPAVSFKAPAAGATLSGTVNSTGCEASASDSNGSVAKVDFYLGTTPVGSKTAAPYQCAIDTTKFANGTHSLMAVATDDQGASASTQRSVSISNTVTPPGDTTPPPAPTLPSTGTKAVPTFESLGLYWKPPSNPGTAGCNVRYRKQGESSWNEGHPMWYDTRDGECRGSLVHLTPATDYEVQFSLPGQQPVAQVNSKTWSESYPIARTVYVPSGSSTYTITEGGTPNGYVLYTGAPGTQAVIDVADAQNFNVVVAKPYVIVRGLTLKGAKQDAVSLQNGAHDVVIENNDISGWGRYRTTNSGGWKLGMDMDAGVRAACRNFSTPLERVVIQRNRIHDPRYGANSWSWGHPAGPQGITFSYCGGNHVFRYNEIYSGDKTRYFNDGIGGEDNFATTGFPVADTDIYGNKISNTWDDAIEAEGGNRNVRIWGNYIDQTAIGIASTVVHHGPLYIFRNVYNRSRHFSEKPLDSDDRNTFLKAGTTSSYGNGRRYVFHNTTLQATQAGVTNPLGAGSGLKGNTGQPLTNTVSRNNIFHVWKSGWSSIMENGGSGNNLDYDLRNGGLSTYAGAESNGTVGFPQYEAGHGWQSESGGLYQLAPASPGYDRGVRLPNFNEGFTGAGPDAGAHEAGTPAMSFGVGASGPIPGTTGGTTTGGTTTGGTTTGGTTTEGSTSTTSGTTTEGSTSTTSGTTTTTTSSGGVCSTVWCAATQ